MAKHIHIYLPSASTVARKPARARDAAPADMKPLVEALLAAIAAREGKTGDAGDFDESKHPRNHGQFASAPGGSGKGGGAPAAKPSSAKASGAKAATHELLSSGHPFHIDELVKATGASKASVMTALSDLKNPKYAGKLGALEIVKGADGMYSVKKKEGGVPAAKYATPEAEKNATAAHHARLAEYEAKSKDPKYHNAYYAKELEKEKALSHLYSGDPYFGKEQPPELRGAWLRGAKPGPDGKPTGKHPELANAERRVAENPSTTGGAREESRMPQASVVPDDVKARLAKLAPKIQAQQGEGKANEKRANSNLGPDMPGHKIPPQPSQKGKLFELMQSDLKSGKAGWYSKPSNKK